MGSDRDAHWHPHCSTSISVLHGGIHIKKQEWMCYTNMVGSWTTKSRLNEMRVTETQFADDAALYATTRGAFESAAAGVADDFGLKLSVQKTKGQ